MEIDEIKELFGFDPAIIGMRYRGFWIIDKPDPWSYYEKEGYLPDCSVGKYPNYVGTEQDSFDCTYRYYYFKSLKGGEKQ